MSFRTVLRESVEGLQALVMHTVLTVWISGIDWAEADLPFCDVYPHVLQPIPPDARFLEYVCALQPQLLVAFLDVENEVVIPINEGNLVYQFCYVEGVTFTVTSVLT